MSLNLFSFIFLSPKKEILEILETFPLLISKIKSMLLLSKFLTLAFISAKLYPIDE